MFCNTKSPFSSQVHDLLPRSSVSRLIHSILSLSRVRPLQSKACTCPPSDAALRVMRKLDRGFGCRKVACFATRVGPEGDAIYAMQKLSRLRRDASPEMLYDLQHWRGYGGTRFHRLLRYSSFFIILLPVLLCIAPYQKSISQHASNLISDEGLNAIRYSYPTLF